MNDIEKFNKVLQGLRILEGIVHNEELPFPLTEREINEVAKQIINLQELLQESITYIEQLELEDL